MSAIPGIFGLGTDYDISATTVFRPAFPIMVLQSGSRIVEDLYQVASLTRVWKVRRDRLDALRPHKGQSDFLYRTLRVVDWDSVDEGAITTITVRYNGFLNPRQAPVYIDDPDTAQRETTIYGPLGSLVLRYLAPTLVRTYATATKPTLRDRYNIKGFDEDVGSIEAIGSNGVALIGDGLPFILSKFPAYKLETVRTRFATPSDGFVFRVSETWERKFVQKGRVNLSTLVSALS